MHTPVPQLDRDLPLTMLTHAMPLMDADYSGMLGLMSVVEGTRAPDGALSDVGRSMLGQVDLLLRTGVLVAGYTGGEQRSLLSTYNASTQLKSLEKHFSEAGGIRYELLAGMERVRCAVAAADRYESDLTSEDISIGLRPAQDARCHALEGVRLLNTWTESIHRSALQRIEDLRQLSAAAPQAPKRVNLTEARMCRAAIACLVDALNTRQINATQRHQLERGIEFFDTRIGQLHFNATQRHQLERGIESFDTRIRQLHFKVDGAGHSMFWPSSNTYQALQSELEAIFSCACLARHALKEEFARRFHAELEASPSWSRPIEGQISIQGQNDSAGQRRWPSQVFSSQIVPAPALLASYGGSGVSSNRTHEARHAVNLAQTRLIGPDNALRFSAVRHGVLSAFGMRSDRIDHASDLSAHSAIAMVDAGVQSSNIGQGLADPGVAIGPHRKDAVRAARAQANQVRAREVVAMVVTGDAALRDTAHRAAQGLCPAPKLDLLSLSLLTPDRLRKARHSNERVMLRDQIAAWKAICGVQTIAVPDGGGTRMINVKIDINPIAMNYGVNRGAVKGLGPFKRLPDALTGWDLSRKINDEAMKVLFGSDLADIAQSRRGMLGKRIEALEQRCENSDVGAGEKLDSIGNDVGTRSKLDHICELQRQIGEIYAGRTDDIAGNEAYKMPTRLAVLADMLGVKIAFNCKSGKDRTGMLDAEIKHLIIQTELTNAVPHPERIRSECEQDHFYEVLMNSGNLDMQYLNTGFAGYKLKHLNTLYRELGAQSAQDPRARDFHGLSAFSRS